MRAAKRLLFLIGYRGSGKTTVGRLLATRLGSRFIDADALLEERAGMSIREIFAQESEPGFRERETAILAELSAGGDAIVATGGGAVLREENRRLLSENGFVAWLSADARSLWARIEADAATASRRPALSVGGLAEVEQLLAMREPLYRAIADIEVPVAALSPEQAVDAILASWTFPSPKHSG